MQQYIRRLIAKNYGCLKDVEVDLTPLHAFIGPNDSGKSTLLRAARTIVHLASDRFLSTKSPENLRPFEPDLYQAQSDLRLTAETTGGLRLSIIGLGKEAQTNEVLQTEDGTNNESKRRTLTKDSESSHWPYLNGAQLVRFDPDALRKSSHLLTDEGIRGFYDDRGFGLPGIYDAILNRGDDAFQKIVIEARKLFPAVKNIRLRVVSSSEKEIEIELTSGERVPATFISEGLLFYLGFAALQSLSPPSLILVEEPENGLHPARIMQVMDILKHVAKETQVLIATHSPLVINEMQPEEVTVVTRDPVKGTNIHPIEKTPDFEGRSKIYALGELWLSYADGDMEKPLLSGEEPL